MPKIIGKAVRVVEHDGLVIEECAGNVATKDDTLSIARVTVSKPTAEPWLTLDYDEWIVVVKGCLELHSEKDGVLKVKAGETVLVSKGERFRPVFPQGDTEYIPVCLPAFRPDRCIREEEDGTSDVSEKLEQLHSNNAATLKNLAKTKYADVDDLYHMCQKNLWDQAVASSAPYFPPTYEKDGMFTHATAVPERLIKTANYFYTGVEGQWICLRLSRSALYKLGIDTVFEEPKPVGATGVSGLASDTWVCPHIFGGIPTCIEGVVTGTFEMKREPDGTFVSIIGLTDNK